MTLRGAGVYLEIELALAALLRRAAQQFAELWNCRSGLCFHRILLLLETGPDEAARAIKSARPQFCAF
jgi:hypothetical protein